MQRRAPGERIEPYRRREHAPAGHGLRDRLAAWAATVLGTVTGAWPAIPDGIADRDADMWEPLLAVADAAGGRWPGRARVTAVTLVTLSKAGTPSLGIRLLGDLRAVFGDHADAMSTDDILTALHKLTEAPWNEIGKPPSPSTRAAWPSVYANTRSGRPPSASASGTARGTSARTCGTHGRGTCHRRRTTTTT
jgi:hypothetical protein